MFTGLIEKIGTVCGLRRSGKGMVLKVDTNGLAGDILPGDSVAVNGVCLTATAISGQTVDFDVSGETVAVSTVGALKSDDKVNIELAMRAGGRFGGHIVQGHIDGIASIKSIANNGDFYDLAVSASPQLMDLMVKKGSVSVNGISLTIASLGRDYFTVAVIPVTWRQTVLQYLRAGDKVNIEADLVVKTIKARLESMLGQSSGSGGSLTIEKLRDMGF